MEAESPRVRRTGFQAGSPVPSCMASHKLLNLSSALSLHKMAIIIVSTSWVTGKHLVPDTRRHSVNVRVFCFLNQVAFLSFLSLFLCLFH